MYNVLMSRKVARAVAKTVEVTYAGSRGSAPYAAH